MAFTGTYNFANVSFKVHHSYELIRQRCRNYKTDKNPVFSIEITPPMIELEERRENLDAEGHAGVLEILILHRMFCESAVFDNVLCVHSSALCVGGKAYLFAAPSGTGKSTHAALWREMLRDQVTIINDDKPFIRQENGKFMVYGSPWNGKHHLGNNISAPLVGICFLSQGKENSIFSLPQQEKFPLLLQQTYRPESEEGTKIMLRLLVEMSEQIPMWHLNCTISREAAELSYNTMRNATL